jgi:NAD(P)-dependent dehydrogenase (short-subunit alcohol dehydrogenase family)
MTTSPHHIEHVQVTMVTNYWGPFYLTHLLLPSLKRAERARIVMTASLSEVHGDIDWEDLK